MSNSTALVPTSIEVSIDEHDEFFGVSKAATAHSESTGLADPLMEGEEILSSAFAAPSDELLIRFHRFLLQHDAKLGELRESLAATVTEAWGEENSLIGLDMAPRDSLEIGNLVQSENVQFKKILSVFAYLNQEMKELKQTAETKFYGPLTMFGHGAAESKEASDDAEADASEVELTFGAFLPLLQDLSNFLRRSFAVLRNALNQFACLYHERQKLYSTTFKRVELSSVYESIGGLMRVFITLDAIVKENAALAQSWAKYKRMIKYVRADPGKYAVDVPKLRVFESLLLQLDRFILSGHIVESCLNQEYGLPGTENTQAAHLLVAGNRVLAETLQNGVKNWLKRLLASQGESIEYYERPQLVDLLGFYVLFRRLFKSTMKVDKRLFNEFWALQRKIPLIPLFGRAHFLVADFLSQFAAIDSKPVAPTGKEIQASRLELLRESDESLLQKTEEYYMAVSVWSVRMVSELAPSKLHTISSVLNARAKLLINGLLLAAQIHSTLTTSVYSHLFLRESFKSKHIRCYGILMELLKSIESTFQQRMAMIGENISLMVGQTNFTLKRIIHPMKKTAEAMNSAAATAKNGGKIDESRLDLLAAQSLILQLCDQPPSPNRLNILHLSMSIATMSGLLNDEFMEEIRYQINKLTILSNFQLEIRRYTDCSFLFWFPNLIPAMLEDIYKNPTQATRLPHLFSSFRDCFTPFAGFNSVERQKYRDGYEKEVLNAFETAILKPLCRDVETDLRLHIHSVVLQQTSLRSQGAGKDLNRFIQLPAFLGLSSMIDLKTSVTHYLDSMFYNLNTVALHDWRIYAEMRNLAREKYGLEMMETHLPGTAHYSENLDILEIMRNIHLFCARFNYNLNTQVFMERAFDQKHLNVLHVAHIADSLRTHGLGVSNTTVNFIYQFLVRKFKIFSEFLYDDHIKSRLLKTVRYFKQEKEKLNNRFPYHEAEKLVKDIRKLGVSEDGSTFLDQFRRQITEIGNSLGYVRMVRSGGLHFISEAIKFVPDLNSIQEFESQTRDQGLSAPLQQVAKVFDQTVDELAKNFSESTDYFPILVNIFQPVLKNATQMHLSNFYAIIPALTINFVEKSIQMKEKLSKVQPKQEASFTDDGFSLGLAYILKVLDLESQFDSLHWWESVNFFIGQKKHEAQQAQVAASKDKSKKGKLSEEEQQQLAMQMKKLNSIQLEFELLFYSFSGARIFFQEAGPSVALEDKNKEKKEEQQMPPPVGDAAAPPPIDAGSVPAAPPLDLPEGVPMAPPM